MPLCRDVVLSFDMLSAVMLSVATPNVEQPKRDWLFTQFCTNCPARDKHSSLLFVKHQWKIKLFHLLLKISSDERSAFHFANHR